MKQIKEDTVLIIHHLIHFMIYRRLRRNNYWNLELSISYEERLKSNRTWGKHTHTLSFYDHTHTHDVSNHLLIYFWLIHSPLIHSHLLFIHYSYFYVYLIWFYLICLLSSFFSSITDKGTFFECLDISSMKREYTLFLNLLPGVSCTNN